MRIGIDAHAAQGQTTGLGVYVAALVKNIVDLNQSHEILLFGKSHQSHGWSTPRRLLWENFELPQLAKKENVDLLHVPAFAMPVRTTSFKKVVTVHDLIGRLFPNQRGRVSRLYWKDWLPRSVKMADILIADSNSTKHDIIEQLEVDHDRIRVIYPSGHEGFTPDVSEDIIQSARERLGIGKNYFIFVGTIEPRKNLNRVVEAFRQFLDRGQKYQDYQLVIVGSKGFAHGEEFKSIVNKARSSSGDLAKKIHFTGYLPKADLNALYRGSRCLVFPSLYEGFGIPVLEAMASGTAVISSKTSSLPEVCGDAALLVDPTAINEISSALELLATNDSFRTMLIQKGLKQIKKFSWIKTAQETMQVYEELCP